MFFIMIISYNPLMLFVVFWNGGYYESFWKVTPLYDLVVLCGSGGTYGWYLTSLSKFHDMDHFSSILFLPYQYEKRDAYVMV